MDEGNPEGGDDKDQIGKLDIIVDLPMPELTNEEERNLADMKHHGSNVREEMISHDYRASDGIKSIVHKTNDPNEWRQWSLDDCQRLMEDPATKDQAQFRFAEIFQNNLKYDQAL